MRNSVHEILRFAWGRQEYPIMSLASYGQRGSRSEGELTKHDLLAEACMIQSLLHRNLSVIQMAYLGAAFGYGRDKINGVMALSAYLWPSSENNERTGCDILVMREFMAGRKDRPSIRRISDVYGIKRWILTGMDKETRESMKVLGDAAISEAHVAMQAVGLLEEAG